ncbi:MAG TPA: SRPBCC family protein [Rubrobacter sp.]|nr:SRPBCC family protein [Rubrobacter sp.]
MQEYEQSKAVAAPANEVFAWVSDVENLPKYLPPIKDAGIEGSAAAGSPGERVKMRVEIPDRGEFDSEGYFDVDAEARTMRWGAETGRDYSGRLTVAEAGDGQSEVTVHLSFDPRSVEGEIQEDSSDDRDPLEESLEATLESIRRQIEEGSGKLSPPSPEG